MNRPEAFDRIYARGGWSGHGSGGGSDPRGARPYVEFVEDFVRGNAIKHVVDIGCGDWQMWHEGAFSEVDSYVGLDVAERVIVENRRHFAAENRLFEHLDAVEAIIPAGDLALCKEVIQHLGNCDTAELLSRLAVQFPHVIICADLSMESTSSWRRSLSRVSPLVGRGSPRVNSEILAGGYRPVDLEREPFRHLGYRLAAQYVHVTGGRCMTTKGIWHYG